jgi:two-component system, NtrC family, response regulator AtoC
MNAHSVLVVDDDERLLQTLAILVRQLGHHVLTAHDVATAQTVLQSQEVDLVITDLRMPGGSGMDLLRFIQRDVPGTPVIMLTAFGSVEGAVEAMQQGAFDFVLKPFDANEMEVRIGRALDLRRVQREHAYLREAADDGDGFDDLIGVSAVMRKVFGLIEQVAPSSVGVLITGETGTGKELVARAIHRRSPRAEALFVPVNLAAVPVDLLESELFGHVRGAYTGALADRPGKFELAHNGTLFLDEIGEAPGALQPKLLRTLQDGVVERVGGHQSRQVDVRLVTATNRDLEVEIAAGRFRSDLYYRFRVIEIAMPALRDRRDDIPYLVAHFLRKASGRQGSRRFGISEPALRLLQEYPWPGNVRELENVIARAVVLCRGEVIGTELLDLRTPGAPGPDTVPRVRLDDALDRLEKEMILRALEETKQVKVRAARVLGISERSLWYKLRKHGLS